MITAKELWNSSEENNKLVKIAMLYSEITGIADNFLSDYEIASINKDKGLRSHIKASYILYCVEKFEASEYYKEEDWDCNTMQYRGNLSYEEFLDMIKNNK